MTQAVTEVEAAGLVAWTVEVDDPGELLTWLPAGQAFGFLRGGDGVVGWGEAVRLTTTDPAEVSAHHWRHVHNRLTAGEEPRRYTVEQHRALLLRRRVDP